MSWRHTVQRWRDPTNTILSCTTTSSRKASGWTPNAWRSYEPLIPWGSIREKRFNGKFDTGGWLVVVITWSRVEMEDPIFSEVVSQPMWPCTGLSLLFFLPEPDNSDLGCIYQVRIHEHCIISVGGVTWSSSLYGHHVPDCAVISAFPYVDRKL